MATKGCCTNCNGTGGDPAAYESNGKCFDCYGTGHTHPLDQLDPPIESGDAYQRTLARLKRHYELSGLPWESMVAYETDYILANSKADPPWYRELDYLWDVRD